MAAVAEAAARDARRARRIRAIGWPVAIAAAVLIVYTTAGLMMSAFSAIVIGALNLLVSAVVKVATMASAGGDVWSIAASLGRATAARARESVRHDHHPRPAGNRRRGADRAAAAAAFR